MHDKVVRRRRAVLALLVALSLFLLTAYFGESAGGAAASGARTAVSTVRLTTASTLACFLASP